MKLFIVFTWSYISLFCRGVQRLLAYFFILDPDVRRCVFLSFDQRFDLHLAQSDHLNYLFLALYDEVFDIRCLVMQRLGRLSDINPACVQPNLRKVLLHVSYVYHIILSY